MSNLKNFKIPENKNSFLNKKKFDVPYKKLTLYYENEEYCFYKKDKLILKMKFKYNKLIIYENDLSFNSCFYQAYIIYFRLFYQFKKAILNKNEIMRIFPYYKINNNLTFFINKENIILKPKYNLYYSSFIRPDTNIFRFMERNK